MTVRWSPLFAVVFVPVFCIRSATTSPPPIKQLQLESAVLCNPSVLSHTGDRLSCHPDLVNKPLRGQ
jgi:hypothetical protein